MDVAAVEYGRTLYEEKDQATSLRSKKVEFVAAGTRRVPTVYIDLKQSFVLMLLQHTAGTIAQSVASPFILGCQPPHGPVTHVQSEILVVHAMLSALEQPFFLSESCFSLVGGRHK